jgi:hypothetical protein
MWKTLRYRNFCREIRVQLSYVRGEQADGIRKILIEFNEIVFKINFNWGILAFIKQNTQIFYVTLQSTYSCSPFFAALNRAVPRPWLSTFTLCFSKI